MKLTDMNLYCIENCLDLLQIEDLLNAASSNKRLCRAANSIYDQKHRNKKISFNIQHDICPYNSAVTDRDQTITVYTFRLILMFLRCFGFMVTNVSLEGSIYYKTKKRNHRSIIQLIVYVFIVANHCVTFIL